MSALKRPPAGADYARMSEPNSEVRKLRQSVDALIGFLVIVALVCAIVFWAAPALKHEQQRTDAYQYQQGR